MTEKRNRFIRKSNELAQKATASTNLIQTRIKHTILALSLPELYEGNKEIVLKNNDIKKLIGIKTGGHSNELFYNALNDAAKEFFERIPLRDEITGEILKDKDGNNRYKFVYYFSEFEQKDDSIKFTFNERILPHILPKSNYTLSSLSILNRLGSVYSQKLYEYLKSIESFEAKYKRKPICTVDDLRIMLLVDRPDKYKTWSKFRQVCLDKPIEDINTKTDLLVTYTSVKEKRSVIALEFTIRKKKECIDVEADEIIDASGSEQLEDYYGSLLTKSQYDEICEMKMKTKIIELGLLKQNHPTTYRKYQGKDRNKSDYEIILNFIAKDKLSEETKKKNDQVKISTPEYFKKKTSDEKNERPNKELLQQIKEMQAKMGGNENDK